MGACHVEHHLTSRSATTVATGDFGSAIQNPGLLLAESGKILYSQAPSAPRVLRNRQSVLTAHGGVYIKTSNTARRIR